MSGDQCFRAASVRKRARAVGWHAQAGGAGMRRPTQHMAALRLAMPPNDRIREQSSRLARNGARRVTGDPFLRVVRVRKRTRTGEESFPGGRGSVRCDALPVGPQRVAGCESMRRGLGRCRPNPRSILIPEAVPVGRPLVRIGFAFGLSFSAWPFDHRSWSPAPSRSP